MTKFALYVPLEAKPGKEKEVADFLRSAVPLVNAEVGTISWFAIQEGPSSFAIFDTFDDETGRDAHLNQGGGGINGKSQDRRPVCQTAGDPQAWNSRGQASKIKVVSTSLSEKAQARRMRELAPTKSDSCGRQLSLITNQRRSR